MPIFILHSTEHGIVNVKTWNTHAFLSKLNTSAQRCSQEMLQGFEPTISRFVNVCPITHDQAVLDRKRVLCARGPVVRCRQSNRSNTAVT